jgi:xanthine/uracil permease
MVLSRVRLSYPLQWGSPTFDAGDVFGVMTAAFAALVESTGGFYAVSRLAGATPPPPYVMSRGIGWQGIGVLLDGFFGTFTGATVAPENVGLIGLTRVGSRRVIQISAVFMIFFSIFGECLWQALLEILICFLEGNTDILPSNEIIDCDIISSVQENLVEFLQPSHSPL